jgi:hypothetical protein
MPAADKASTPAYEAFAADLLARAPGVSPGSLFGMPCLKVAGKAFAGSYAGGTTFKLPPSIRAQAMALPGAGPFDPSGKGRPMKEWVVVPAQHQSAWDEFADAALAFVLGPSARDV